METQEVLRRFKEFQTGYHEDDRDAIWKQHCARFREFWDTRIMNSKAPEPTEAEIDQIVRILDTNAKGNTRRDEAVARVMTPQGVWRRLFRELRRDARLRDKLNAILKAEKEEVRARLLDDLYKTNEGKKNGLTGKSGNVLNAFLVAHAPFENLSVISLNDRRRLIEMFNIPGGPDFEKDSQGRKLVTSNSAIISWFKAIGLGSSSRTVSRFLYSPMIKDAWRGDQDNGVVPTQPTQTESIPTEEKPANDDGARLFYMESQLEDFIIENWDKTELGKKFDLIEESGEVVSQQYPTDIGKIDILAQDKKTKQYVVIELKKGQTSDDTVGQLTRYMGWLEEHKTGNKATKGIIIAGEYDRRLHYALKKIKDVEVYLYRVDFKLEEFEKTLT